jgi:glycosyltransferase involved in cell wall biosynthesis
LREAPDHNPEITTTTLKVSVVVPVYNESSRIASSLGRIWMYFQNAVDVPEIIVVDDGSNDDTLQVARRFAEQHSHVQVLAEPHRGKASAVLAGLGHASGDVVGFMDVDLATPLEAWEEVRTSLESGADIAIGSREGIGAERIAEPGYRHIMGRVFNGLVQLLLLPGIHDTQCGFKFFTRKALDDVLPRTLLYRDASIVKMPRVTAFDVELLFIARQLGYRIAVIPVTWQYGDQSKVNPLTDTLQNLRDVLVVRLNGWRGRYR